MPALREILAREGVTDPLWYEVKKSRRAPGPRETYIAAACLRVTHAFETRCGGFPAPPTAA